jgi:hypothetical protein
MPVVTDAGGAVLEVGEADRALGYVSWGGANWALAALPGGLCCSLCWSRPRLRSSKSVEGWVRSKVEGLKVKGEG